MFADPLIVPILTTEGAPSAASGDAFLVDINGNNTVRRFDTAPGVPRYLRISHNRVGKGDAMRDRHLARMESFALDADGVEDPSKMVSLYTVLDIPVYGVSNTVLESLARRHFGLFYGNSGVDPNTFDVSVFVNRWNQGES